MEQVLHRFTSQVDEKYSHIVGRFRRELTHPERTRETELGNLFADIFTRSLGVDVMLIGSGSIRAEKLGPIVTYGDLIEGFPYDDGVFMFKVTGRQLRQMLRYMLREEAYAGHTEFYQLPSTLRLRYDRAKGDFDYFTYCGKEVGKEIGDDALFTVGLQNYHFKNIESFFNISYETICKLQKPRTLESQYDDLVADVVKKFNETQSLITVEAQYIGSYKDINEALVAAHAAGTGLPAIAVANTDYVASYGDSGLFENLDPYIEGTSYDTDDFSAGLLLSSQFEGKQVALPFLHSTQVIYYNKTMADANGWTIPEKIEDFTPFLAEVHKTAGVYGTVVPGWDQWYFETMYLNEGVQIITDDNTCDLGSDTALGVTSMIKDWCDAGDAYFAAGTDASATMRQNFYDQKTFSVMHTSSLYNNYVDKCPDFEVGMAWYPAASTGDKNSEVGGCVLGIPSKNDQATKNAAWQFLQFLCGKEVNMEWAEGTGYLPTRNSVLETDEGKQFLEKKPAFQCIFDNLNLINPRIQNSAWSELATTWKNYMEVIMNQGGDVNSNSEDMVTEIDEILADHA